jgi:hypothetical protein
MPEGKLIPELFTPDAPCKLRALVMLGSCVVLCLVWWQQAASVGVSHDSVCG